MLNYAEIIKNWICYSGLKKHQIKIKNSFTKVGASIFPIWKNMRKRSVSLTSLFCRKCWMVRSWVIFSPFTNKRSIKIFLRDMHIVLLLQQCCDNSLEASFLYSSLWSRFTVSNSSTKQLVLFSLTENSKQLLWK